MAIWKWLPLFSALCLACTHVPNPAPMPPDADAAPWVQPHTLDGAVDCTQPGPKDPCREAGENLCRLGCAAGGQPLWRTPKGTPYAEACRRAVLDGRDEMPGGGSRAACLAGINTCALVEECR